ncbi:MAG: hypothetical protein U9R16_03765, partial [Campylobacterota bacterium]|nr:hypothetical protein [Campylobacterota bacterium]
KLAFVKAFRELIRTKNILDVFSDFKWADLLMKSQDFEDYKSKYLDMKETNTKEKVSILNDVDFELELIRRDDINVSYILSLLADFKNSNDEDKKKQKENINNIINGNTSLRSKRELIEKFINENLTQMKDDKSIDEEFGKFWNIEKDIAYEVLCKDENLDCDEVRKVVDKYIYEQRKPLKTDIAKTLKVKPKLLERKEIVPRVLGKIVDFVDKFYDDIGVDLNSNINNLDYNNEEEILIVAEDKVPYGKDK